MKFSILICTIESRAKQLQNLLNLLKPQLTKEVEVLTECDNKQMSVGRKRQILLERAKGDYVAFIDDDDIVSEDYVANILEAIKQDPDCIGMLVRCLLDGKNKLAITSNKYNTWKENVDGFDFVRCILHLNPVKRWIALKIGYKDVRFQEDHNYSLELNRSGLLQKEVMIEKELYTYLYKYQPHHIKYGV